MNWTSKKKFNPKDGIEKGKRKQGTDVTSRKQGVRWQTHCHIVLLNVNGHIVENFAVSLYSDKPPKLLIPT